jgi:hypothetical protein
MQVRRTYAWLVLAGYCSLALAIPALTPAPDLDALPPIAPLALIDNSGDEDMMLQLHQQASAAMKALQSQQTASVRTTAAF